jgi:hypothetical protein
MKRKSVASAVCSALSIGAQFLGLSCASSVAVVAASGGEVPRTVLTAIDLIWMLAIPLALVAVVLAGLSWSKESQWVRVPVLCLSGGAVLWSLVMV